MMVFQPIILLMILGDCTENLNYRRKVQVWLKHQMNVKIE